jgi:arsenite-transporting ATPase
VILLTGKGGVGKTSLAAATALYAGACGHRTTLVSTDAAHSLGDALGRPVGADPVEIAKDVVAQEVAVLAELERSWGDIRDWLTGLLIDDDAVAAEEILVLPGLEELVALRAIHEADRRGDCDVCVVDCAPTAETLRMLRLPDALRLLRERFWDAKRRAARLLRPLAEGVGAGRFVAPEAVFDAFERLYDDIAAVRDILGDETRSSARLVVNPARVVVAETRRTFAYLSLHGIATDALFVNRVLPDEAAGGYFARWREREREQLDDIERSFPIPRLSVPLRPAEPIGVAALTALGKEAYAGRDPAERFVERRPLRISRRDGRMHLALDLPSTSHERVDVACVGDELEIAVDRVRRRIALPAAARGLGVSSATLRDGVLEIAFEGAP